MGFFGDLKSLLTTGSRHRGGDGVSGDRAVENEDAEAAASTRGDPKGVFNVAGPSYPPGYVKDYDEGRPRK